MTLLKRLQIDMTQDTLMDLIYHAEKPKDVLPIFTEVNFDALHVDMKEVFSVFMDAWNHFPHESLGGLCPVEMMFAHASRPDCAE
jgi:hypothetical protein